MLSRLRTIGFGVETAHHAAALAAVALQAGHPMQGRVGRTIHWGPDNGVELWVPLDASDGSPLGLEPHFIGRSRVQLHVTKVHPDHETGATGLIEGWVAPPAELGANGEYPVALSVPDFDCWADAAEPDLRLVVQVAAFAEQLWTFESAEAFRRSEGLGSLATMAAIPVGLFRPGGEPIQPPQPRALLVGHVEAIETRKNPLTGAEFVWISLESLGGWFDVVAAPEDVGVGLRPGAIAAGVFWLSAEVAPASRLAKFGLTPVVRPGFETRAEVAEGRAAPSRKQAGLSPVRKPRAALKLALALVALAGVLAVGFVGFRLVQFASYIRAQGAAPGEEAFRAANRQLHLYRGAATLGNTAEAVELAATFARIQGGLDESPTATREDGAPSVTKGGPMVYCECHLDSCAFLVHVPGLRGYDGDAKRALHESAWRAARMAVSEQRPGRKTNIAVALRGAVLYESIQVGASTGSPVIYGDAMREMARLYPFFASAPAATAGR